ncbi:ATP-binding cassette domain-containing protein [Klebsiella pneumoniae]
MAIVNLQDLQVTFGAKTAVSAASFRVDAGETFSLIGASGCGKSTILRVLAGLQREWRGSVDLLGQAIMPGARFQGDLRRNVQMVFQDPWAALNPRKTIFDLVGEPLLIHEQMPAVQRTERVAQLLQQVGLPAEAMRRYPHQFSGGQRQRICIARALALNPKVIIADESVSALDVSVQAQVLTLLEDLRQRYRLSYLFISHDMAVVERICHRVAVMFGGQLVEIGPRDRVLHHPQHPYTQHLLSAVPIPDVQQRRQPRATSAMPIRPEPIKPIGYQRVPQRFTDFGDGHLVAC